jgi:hypothetical protein
MNNKKGSRKAPLFCLLETAHSGPPVEGFGDWAVEVAQPLE